VKCWLCLLHQMMQVVKGKVMNGINNVKKEGCKRKKEEIEKLVLAYI